MALFLDRDGTLIEDAHYLKDPEELKIIPSAGPSLHKAKNAGFFSVYAYQSIGNCSWIL